MAVIPDRVPQDPDGEHCRLSGVIDLYPFLCMYTFCALAKHPEEDLASHSVFLLNATPKVVFPGETQKCPWPALPWQGIPTAQDAVIYLLRFLFQYLFISISERRG